MKIVVSPAKSLNFESPLPIQNYTESSFLKEAETIQKTLKKKKPKDLMELMDISEKLADLNWERNQNWSLPFTPENARPAVYAFDGDVYTGLDAYSIPADKIAVL
ncbi:MAG: peroxide stress protein YaaA, partial [Flavobacterium sp.]